MKLTTVFATIAAVCVSFVTATDSEHDKCITRSEAEAFIKDYHIILQRAPGWEALSYKRATPDFEFRSGSIYSLLDRLVGDSNATVFFSRAEWIAYMGAAGSAVTDGPIETLHLDISGCNVLIDLRKWEINGRTIIGYERFELKIYKGNWAVYLTQPEMDSLGWAGGYEGACAGPPPPPV